MSSGTMAVGSTALRAACVLASLVTLAACTTSNDASGAGETATPPSSYHAPSAGGQESALLPVLSVDDSIPPGVTGELVPGVYALLGEPSAEQQLVLDRALYVSVKKCMQDQGFALVEPPPTLQEPERTTILFDGYIGILDENYARNYGYQLNLGSIPASDHYRIGQTPDPPDARYEFALKVEGGGGCTGQAERAIEKNRPSEDQSTPLLAKIYQDSLEATYANEDYQKALSSWASCMEEAGFDYASPHDAFSAYHGFSVTAETALRKQTPHPTATEIDTAVTDVACKRSSRLAEVFRHVFWNHQLDMARKNSSTLKVLDEVTAQRLRNARQVIKNLS